MLSATFEHDIYQNQNIRKKINLFRSFKFKLNRMKETWHYEEFNRSMIDHCSFGF